jgi:hypothetical protein
MSRALAALRSAGVLAAVAAGNDGVSTGVTYPACAPAAVSVGAVYDYPVPSKSWGVCNDTNIGQDSIACFSNRCARARATPARLWLAVAAAADSLPSSSLPAASSAKTAPTVCLDPPGQLTQTVRSPACSLIVLWCRLPPHLDTTPAHHSCQCSPPACSSTRAAGSPRAPARPLLMSQPRLR